VVIRSGRARLESASGRQEALSAGDHFGGLALSPGAERGARVRFLEATQAYRLPLESLDNLPVVRWKLIETHRRRYEGH
jgi:hypothetical protein